MRNSILLFIPLVTTAFWFLGALAAITESPRTWLAHNAPAATSLLNCAACSGFWYGAALGLYFDPFEIWWQSLTLVGAGSMIWTPVLAAVLIRALHVISEALNG